jgi:MFS family permease
VAAPRPAAGVLADRVDRRRLVIGVDLARGGVLVVLATALLAGDVAIVAVLAALFVLGVAEVFADTTRGTLLPMVVGRADLGVGNARLMTGTLVMNEMVGPAVGAPSSSPGRPGRSSPRPSSWP